MVTNLGKEGESERVMRFKMRTCCRIDRRLFMIRRLPVLIVPRNSLKAIIIVCAIAVCAAMGSYPARATAELDTEVVPPGLQLPPPDHQRLSPGNQRLSPGNQLPPPGNQSPSQVDQNSPPQEFTLPKDPSRATDDLQTTEPFAGAPRKGTVLHAIRLPLSMTGSRLPTITTGRPPEPPPLLIPINTTNGPQLDMSTHPLAWRATAEAIRNQPAAKTLLVSTYEADQQTTARCILEEAERSGFRVDGLSLRAGHILLKMPTNPLSMQHGRFSDIDLGTGSDTILRNDFVWLIIVLTPSEPGRTEMHLKIQARGASRFVPNVSAFLQRVQTRLQSPNAL